MIPDLTKYNWAVIDYDRIIERDLTYAQTQAALEMAKPSSGLCIVTNDVAERFEYSLAWALEEKIEELERKMAPKSTKITGLTIPSICKIK